MEEWQFNSTVIDDILLSMMWLICAIYFGIQREEEIQRQSAQVKLTSRAAFILATRLGGFTLVFTTVSYRTCIKKKKFPLFSPSFHELSTLRLMTSLCLELQGISLCWMIVHKSQKNICGCQKCNLIILIFTISSCLQFCCTNTGIIKMHESN